MVQTTNSPSRYGDSSKILDQPFQSDGVLLAVVDVGLRLVVRAIGDLHEPRRTGSIQDGKATDLGRLTSPGSLGGLRGFLNKLEGLGVLRMDILVQHDIRKPTLIVRVQVVSQDPEFKVLQVCC